jgi:hypothetical protein
MMIVTGSSADQDDLQRQAAMVFDVAAGRALTVS